MGDSRGGIPGGATGERADRILAPEQAGFINALIEEEADAAGGVTPQQLRRIRRDVAAAVSQSLAEGGPRPSTRNLRNLIRRELP